MPSTQPTITGLGFYNFDANNDFILMPASLHQATGSGASTWTISDTLKRAAPFVSALSLVNQGTLYVNGSNSLTAGNATTNWTLTGDTKASAGNQFFDDGAIAIVGTSGGARATTANFTGNLSVIGSGVINIYGNAILTIGTGVGIGGSQTIQFITDLKIRPRARW